MAVVSGYCIGLIPLKTSAMKIRILKSLLCLATFIPLGLTSCQKNKSGADAAAYYQGQGYEYAQPGGYGQSQYHAPGMQQPARVAATQSARPPRPQVAAQPAAPKGWNPDVAGLAGAAGVANVTYTAGSRSQAYVALTFDDGPHATLTPKLLDILAERNVKATFYVLGPRVKASPGVMQRMVAEGHEVGNHSWTHRVMSKAPDSVVFKEFQDTHDAVVAACGVAPKSQRPPYGSMTKVQRSMLKDKFGYPCILWDVDPLDWKKPGSGVVASRLLSGAKNGSILLLHDIHAGSVDAVPAVIDGLIAKGYTFVTVSQLVSMAGQ